MNIKGLLTAMKKADPNAKTYQLKTDFAFDGLREYPRPQLQRGAYINLNGKWDFSIKDQDGQIIEEGQIQVPFSPETMASGTKMHTLQKNQVLEYKRQLVIDKIKGKKRLLLHFGAVDQIATVTVNGQEIGSHTGGYTAFSFDITDYIFEGVNDLSVKVIDTLDSKGYARGKQSYKSEGMWYSAQSGIWQTVWMEWVPKSYVKAVRAIPHINQDGLELVLKVSKLKDSVEIKSPIAGLIESVERLDSQEENQLRFWLKLKDYQLWSPDNPQLYFLNITYGRDSFSTYFAMREFSTGADDRGYQRILLNGQPIFLNGILDQGYYPESLMTPPSDAAMLNDLEVIKSLGFNMIRKHCKLEPMRWYFHCDRLGLIVWQDIVNGGLAYNMNMICSLPTVFKPWQGTADTKKRLWKHTGRYTEESRQLWFKEAKEMLEQLINVPSVGLWTIFNEGWGQFEGEKCLDFAKSIDDSRLYDLGSGWFKQTATDVVSDHIYFDTLRSKKTDKPYVISEYGGYSLKINGHVSRDAIYGYKNFDSMEGLSDAYQETMAKIKSLENQGLCGAVYTQTTDIMDELNGLMTYDRKVQKVY